MTVITAMTQDSTMRVVVHTPVIARQLNELDTCGQ